MGNQRGVNLIIQIMSFYHDIGNNMPPLPPPISPPPPPPPPQAEQPLKEGQPIENAMTGVEDNPQNNRVMRK
jgi:hypothetical protein